MLRCLSGTVSTSTHNSGISDSSKISKQLPPTHMQKYTSACQLLTRPDGEKLLANGAMPLKLRVLCSGCHSPSRQAHQSHYLSLSLPLYSAFHSWQASATFYPSSKDAFINHLPKRGSSCRSWSQIGVEVFTGWQATLRVQPYSAGTAKCIWESQTKGLSDLPLLTHKKQ